MIVSFARQPPTKEEPVPSHLDRMPRRTFLARGAAALGAAAAVPFVGVERAATVRRRGTIPKWLARCLQSLE